MFWSQGRELLCFFLHRQAIEDLSPAPRRRLWQSTQSYINNPPVEYITTSHARGGGTRTSRESPSASEQDGRVGSFPAAHRTCICFETLPASVPVHSRQLYPTRFVSDPKARTTDQTEGECALLWVALFCCGENLPNPTCRAPPVSFTAPHSVPETAVSADATPLRSPTQFPLSSDNVFLITMRLPTSCIRPKNSTTGTPPWPTSFGRQSQTKHGPRSTRLNLCMYWLAGWLLHVFELPGYVRCGEE